MKSLKHVVVFWYSLRFTFFFIYFFIWLPQVLFAACGIQFPDQGLNLGPLYWEHRVLATGPSGKSSIYF